MGWIATTVVLAVLVIGIAVHFVWMGPLWKEWKSLRREWIAHPDPARKRYMMRAIGGLVGFYLLVGLAFLGGHYAGGLEGGFIAGIAAFVVGMGGLFVFAAVSSARALGSRDAVTERRM